jgi:hypothetical protein
VIYVALVDRIKRWDLTYEIWKFWSVLLAQILRMTDKLFKSNLPSIKLQTGKKCGTFRKKIR